MHADELGLSGEVQERIRYAVDEGLRGIEICRDAGVPVGFGSDLEGMIHPYHMLEFSLRAKVQTPLELIQSATVVNAEILQMDGRLGVVQAGAIADLLVVEGNPVEEIACLIDEDRPRGVLKGGDVVRYDF